MQQVQFETSMKNIPLGGKKEYVMQLSNCNPIFFLPSVADDPFGETDCSTHGIDIDLLYFVYVDIINANYP